MSNTLNTERAEKLDKLRRILKDLGRITVGFSGGVDSTFLSCFATETLGAENVTAVTAVAPNFADDEIEYAKSLAKRIGIKHICVEVELPELFWQNPKDRCYHCKKAVFTQLLSTVSAGAEEDSASGAVCDGKNKDDETDYRPGSIAAKELGVVSPLFDAGLTKAEIRETLKEMGIEIWNKPSFACLASRIPYGTEITEEKLRAVYKIETELRKNGFSQVRARLHGDIIRLELLEDEFGRLISDKSLREGLDKKAHECGFNYVVLDLLGYRMGNLNRL